MAGQFWCFLRYISHYSAAEEASFWGGGIDPNRDCGGLTPIILSERIDFGRKTWFMSCGFPRRHFGPTGSGVAHAMPRPCLDSSGPCPLKKQGMRHTALHGMAGADEPRSSTCSCPLHRKKGERAIHAPESMVPSRVPPLFPP
mgnify:CR=1 FL=1